MSARTKISAGTKIKVIVGDPATREEFGKEVAEVLATRNGLAVVLDPRGYNVTHIRTGYRVSTRYVTKRAAVAAMNRVATILPWPKLTMTDSKDRQRLGKQLAAVLNVMLDGRAWTIEGLQEALRLDGIVALGTSISARIRELPSIGYPYERKQIARGLYTYQLTGEWTQPEPRKRRHCHTCNCNQSVLGGTP